jgi:hypothetical protein
MSYNGSINYSTQSGGILLDSTEVIEILTENGNRISVELQFLGSTANNCYIGFSSSRLCSTDAIMVLLDRMAPVMIKHYQGSLFAITTSSGMLYVNETII